MAHYFIFVALATVTVFSPGPGVLLTLSNSIRFGFTGSVSGILGIAAGTFAVAAASAAGLGVILSVSTLAFTLMKTLGAAYLIYLGIRLWRSDTQQIADRPAGSSGWKKRFAEGALIQITNPKAVLFFMSVFPQFIDYSHSTATQFTRLVVTYAVLVILIHTVYALVAGSFRTWFQSPGGTKVLNRLGGGTFICFGAGLAASNR